MTSENEVLVDMNDPEPPSAEEWVVERLQELGQFAQTREPERTTEEALPVALVLRPFDYLLRHTPIRPKTGRIDAADEQDARERIRRKHRLQGDFEVEITPALKEETHG